MNRLYVIGAATLGFAFFAVSSGNITQAATLYPFQGGTDGGNPWAGLVVGIDGYLYGTTYLGGTHNFGTVFRMTASGAKTVLYNFQGGMDGSYPQGGVVYGLNGTLYGATVNGGGSPACLSQTPPITPIGCGTVYKLTPESPQGTMYKEQVIWSFQGGSDGSSPVGPLTTGKDGTLYGTTSEGGGYSCVQPPQLIDEGCGTIFKVTPSSATPFQTLYPFKGGSDGGGPRGRLTLSDDGMIYGTTWVGGNTGCMMLGCGTVFMLNPSTCPSTCNDSTIYRFQGGTSDGYAPRSAVIIGKDGALIGLTTFGGNGFTSYDPNAQSLGNGIAFEIAPSIIRRPGAISYTEHVLYFFKGPTNHDGSDPIDENGLSMDQSGNLYGTTASGGDPTSCGGAGCGTVFKLVPPAVLNLANLATGPTYTDSVLYSFLRTNGQNPRAAPVLYSFPVVYPFRATTALYGTTFDGATQAKGCDGKNGGNGCGVVYTVTP